MRIKSILGFVLALAAGQSLAQTCPCDGTITRLNATQIANTLAGKFVCATRGGDKWQEFHRGSAATALSGSPLPVIDYKQGPGHPVDPSKVVGKWQIVGTGLDAVVRYDYGSPSTTYDMAVCSSGGGTLTFCSTPTITGATTQAAAPCP